VLQAMGAEGPRAFVLRALALTALFAWHLLDRLDRASPDGRLAQGSARALLLAVPLVVTASWSGGWALLALDGQAAKDCCSVVYDGARGLGPGEVAGASALLPAMLAGAAALIALGGAMAASPRLARRQGASTMLAILAAAWIPAAVVVLVGDLSPYHFGNPAHHCPWCLFAGRAHAVGYPLFFALAVVALDAGAALMASAVARRVPELAGPAISRVRAGALRTALAVLAFLAIAAAPALLYRMQNGAWMG